MADAAVDHPPLHRRAAGLRRVLVQSAGLAGGVIVLVWWLIALAIGPEYFAYTQALLGSWVGRLLLLGWTWATFYHLCNGIRHLCWDGGWGFELSTARNSGIVVVILSVLLTLAAWIIAYAARGG